MRPSSTARRQLRRLVLEFGHVDIDRVERPNRRQHRRLVRRHQRARRQRRLVDPAADRRGDLCIIEIDAGGLDGRLFRRHFGVRLRQRRVGVVEVLFADGVLLDQALVTIDLGLSVGDSRFGLLQRRDRAVVRGLITRRIKLVERVSGLDQEAFLKQSRLDDAVHLRPHFGRQRRRRAAGQFAGDRNRLRMKRDDAHLRLHRGRAHRPGAVLAVAGGQQPDQRKSRGEAQAGGRAELAFA